jgi:hypothetical protein
MPLSLYMLRIGNPTGQLVKRRSLDGEVSVAGERGTYVFPPGVPLSVSVAGRYCAVVRAYNDDVEEPV